MENEATVFGAQSCPSRKRWRRCRRLALFFSSCLLRLLLSDGRFCVVLCSSLCFFFSSSSSLERAAREREKRARAKKSMHVNLEQKRRDVSACFRSSVDDFFLLLSLLRRVSFKRTKDQPTNTKEEALKVFCKYIYIYNARKWIALLCIARACVVIFFFVKEGWWSDGTTRKSDVFVLSAPKKKERSLKTKRDKKKVPCGKKVQPL